MPKTRAPLTEKQERFVAAYAKSGNATEAAREAGYAHPNQYGPTVVKLGPVAKAIKARGKARVSKAIADADEIQTFLSGVMRGKVMDSELSLSGDPIKRPTAVKTRVDAAFKLAKMRGYIVEQHKHSGDMKHEHRKAPDYALPEVVVRLRELAKADPEVRALLAEAVGG